MKRLVAAVLVASTLVLSAPVVRAYDDSATEDADQYEDAFSNPLRLAYYIAHPIGFTAEWLIMRPLQYIFSRPYLDRFFGYTPISEEGTYQKLGEHM